MVNASTDDKAASGILGNLRMREKEKGVLQALNGGEFFAQPEHSRLLPRRPCETTQGQIGPLAGGLTFLSLGRERHVSTVTADWPSCPCWHWWMHSSRLWNHAVVLGTRRGRTAEEIRLRV